jgi:hypothetical protein
MMFQIEIPKRASRCFKGGEVLNQGESYYSALILNDHEQSYHRQDYCLLCWESNHSKIEGMVSSWKSVVPVKKGESELPKRRDERALYLLKEALSNQESPEAKEEAFVLSLYLARRRLIALRQELKRGAAPFSLYEVSETEEMLCVPKISLSDLRIEKVQQELSRKFTVS